MGSSLGSQCRFGHLVLEGGCPVDKREGAVGCEARSPPLLLIHQPHHGRSVCRQLHGRGLSSRCRGTSSPALNTIAQRILWRSELHHVRLAPQFIMERHNVLADSLSRPDQIQRSEWTLHMEVFRELRRKWLVMVDLFATSANHRCSIYFSAFRDPQAMGMDSLLQSWDHLQAYAFPPWSMLPQVLHKLRWSSGVNPTQIAPYWPQRPWFPNLLDLAVDLPIALLLHPALLNQPRSRHRHRGLRRLRLHAWRLSSDLPGLRGSPPV